MKSICHVDRNKEGGISRKYEINEFYSDRREDVLSITRDEFTQRLDQL